MDSERELRDRALSGDSVAVRKLVATVLPVVQVRIARVLSRRARTARDLRQEVEDFAQEVFATLFEENGRVLRAWDAERGLSLASFCGLIAEREASSILRSGRRSAWKEHATEMNDLEDAVGVGPDAEVGIASRDQLRRLTERLRDELSPRGLELFHRLIVNEEEVEAICESTGMTPAALYAWRSRLGKLARKIATELRASDPQIVTSPRQNSATRGVGNSEDGDST